MHSRHFPRLCRSCDAPMARQEDICWSCGAAWDYRSARQNRRRVITGADAASVDGGGQSTAPADIGNVPAVAQARLAVDRWADEGGSLAAEEPRRGRAGIAAVK
jgi:hypothetical protein